MTPAGPTPLEVTGSLSFVLDTPDGSTAGRVEGDGRRVRVVADDPVAVWESAAGPGLGRPAVAGLADLLAEAGLVVEVTGPHGTVATVGAGVDSRLGQVLAGSRRLRPGRVGALRPLAAARVRSRGRPGRVAASVLAVAVVLLLRRRAARR